MWSLTDYDYLNVMLVWRANKWRYFLGGIYFKSCLTKYLGACGQKIRFKKETF